MTFRHRLYRHTVSFKYAVKGIVYALRTQPNFLIHLFFAVVVLLLGIFFRIAWFEWLILTLTVALVLVAEMLNTALEIVTDALKEHKRNEKDDYYIMVAKDVAAGAVLVSAVFAVVVGLTIFGPRLAVLLVPK